MNLEVRPASLQAVREYWHWRTHRLDPSLAMLYEVLLEEHLP